MKKTTGMRNLFLLISVASALLLGACEQANQSSQKPLKIYRHAMDNSPSSLDPAQASSIYGNFVAVNLYDTLYRYKYLARPYQLEPNLAQALPSVSDDGLRLTIQIRQGVHFIDDAAFEGGIGREVKAEDFVYSIKRHFDPDSLAQGAWVWQGRIDGLIEWKEQGSDYDQPVSGLQAIDDYTIEITLTKPFPQIVHTLTQGYSAIVPREAVEKYGKELGSHPVGSGPFKYVSRDSSRALMERNENFRKIPFDLAAEGYDEATQGDLGLEHLQGQFPPFIDQLAIEFIAESAARWNAFVSGEVQFIKVPTIYFGNVLSADSPTTVLPKMDERYHSLITPETGLIYTHFNMADPAIGYNEDEDRNRRNHALRCAMVKAFDWERNNEVFFHGIGRVFPGVIIPLSPEFDETADQSYIQRDVMAAKELLKQHGWNSENLPTISYGITNSITERQAFEQFRGFMADIGYPPEKIQPRIFASYGDYYRAYSQGKVTMINSSWMLDYPDTENTMHLFYGPNAAPGSNSSSFKNQQYDQLYDLTSSMPESPERTKIYRQMNEIMMSECPSITGISRTMVFLWDKDMYMLPDRSFLGGQFMRFVDMNAGQVTTQ